MDDIYQIIVPHHVLNDYCLKQLVCSDFKAISCFCLFMIRILVINLVIYLKITISGCK